MKKVFYLLTAAFLLAAVQISAKETHGNRNGERNQGRRHARMSLPVYAAKTENQQQPTVMTPEQRARFEATRKRRFEIMVLIGAYKIMPADQREALKAELLKRIEADFHASMQMQKARIAKAEAELKKLRNELAEKEAQADKLVEKELDRLLKMPVPGNRRFPRQNKNLPQAPAAK